MDMTISAAPAYEYGFKERSMKEGHNLTVRIVDFFKSQRGKLIHYIRGRLRDAADRDAEDILQDVMLNILESVDPASPIENLGAYVYRSVQNRITDNYRKPKNQVYLDEPADKENGLTLSEILSDVRYDTHNMIEKREIMERIYKALDSLSSEQKAVWIATELEDHHFEELAVLWDEPMGTLLARKHRASAVLRKKLKDLML